MRCHHEGRDGPEKRLLDRTESAGSLDPKRMLVYSSPMSTN
jgi:hypothetical protein